MRALAALALVVAALAGCAAPSPEMLAIARERLAISDAEAMRREREVAAP